MEEEIDLRPYFVALVRQWRTIMIIVVAAAIGAALIAITLPQGFTASADVLILPTRSQLTFDPRFVTNNTVFGTDTASRRQALIALASSPLLEEQIRAKLPPELVGKEYQPGALANRIRVKTEGDLLHIEATAADTQSAQALADAWGQAYVRSVNDLYGKNTTLLEQLGAQVSDAQKRYDDTQRGLETFVGSSTIVQVGQQISMTVDLLDESRAGTQKLYAQYLTQARDLEATLRDAETLRQQVASGQSEGLANNLAALALRARAVGDVQLPFDLRFDNPGALVQNNSATLTDLDALIGVLQQRRVALIEQSQQLAQAIGDGEQGGGLPTGLRSTYEKRLTTLNQQYEQQTAQLKLLQQRRDLALDSLSLLQRKLDEQHIALGTPEIQVRFISTVVEPLRSTLSRAVLYVGAASILGLFLSVLVILGQAIIQPWFSSKRPQPRGERPLDQPTAS
jgi:capsular polysaccharide biosynthesis protein